MNDDYVIVFPDEKEMLGAVFVSENELLNEITFLISHGTKSFRVMTAKDYTEEGFDYYSKTSLLW